MWRTWCQSTTEELWWLVSPSHLALAASFLAKSQIFQTLTASHFNNSPSSLSVFAPCFSLPHPSLRYVMLPLAVLELVSAVILSVGLSIDQLSFWSSVHLPIHLSVCLFNCLSIHLSVCLFVSASTHLPIHLDINPSVCLYQSVQASHVHLS